MKRTTLTILLLLNLLITFAQSKPVTVLVTLTPPYSPFLNEYAATTTSRLQVTLIVNDSRMINYPVKLQMFVEKPGSGVAMRTAEYAAIPPILLNGGMTEVLSGASLSQYFLAQNNVFTGFDQAQYLQTGRIPDGQYRIGFRVVDAQRSDVLLSNLTYSQPGWFLLNDPPQLNLPQNLNEVEVQNIQDVKLEWYPRHLGSMNSSFATSYQVELFALRVPGLHPQQVALSLPPDYMAITNQNYFRLSQDKFLLEPGIQYAWRVKAMAANDFTLFQNNGYSEVFSFVYGSLCPVPQNTDADVKGTEAAEILWDYNPQPSSWEVRFRLKDEEDAIWHTRQTNNNSVLLSEILSPATGYEYQVKAICSNTESEYSSIKSFNTAVFVPPVNFDCGKKDTAGQVTNFTPKLQLSPGDMIYNGEFPVKLTEVEGGSGSFTGKGRMRIPMLANIQINMQFTDLKVNELNQVFGGEMVSVYNEDSPFFIEDLSDYWGEGDQIGNVITGQDSAAIILTYEVTDPGDLEITIDGDNVVITSGGNTTYADVDDAGSGTTIVDSEGNIFSVDVDDNGNTTVTQVGTSGGSGTSGSDYNDNADTYNQLDNKTTVTFYNNGKWAFDERNPEYEGSLFDSEYEKIGDYYVPWKLVPLGKADKIKARVTSGTIEDPEKLKFLTPTGTEFFAKYENGEYLLEVIGARERDGIELYAIYMPDDTTKISVGKLKIASYPRLDMKVKLVPMGDFHIDGIISENILNEIYNPYYIHWHITIDSEFTNTSWDEGNDGLQGTGSEFYSMFTPEMRALNTAYTEERGVDEKSLYLFIFPDGNSEGNLMGDMPLKSRFGYIFNADGADTRKITQTVAHELGHGAFQLKHTFSDKYGIDQNTTQNLMDYASGTELVKYQWDVVHDPQNKLFNWSQDEEEGQAAITQTINDFYLMYRIGVTTPNYCGKVNKNPCSYQLYDNEELNIELRNKYKINNRSVSLSWYENGVEVTGTDLVTNNDADPKYKVPKKIFKLKRSAGTYKVELKLSYYATYTNGTRKLKWSNKTVAILNIVVKPVPKFAIRDITTQPNAIYNNGDTYPTNLAIAQTLNFEAVESLDNGKTWNVISIPVIWNDDASQTNTNFTYVSTKIGTEEIYFQANNNSVGLKINTPQPPQAFNAGYKINATNTNATNEPYDFVSNALNTIKTTDPNMYNFLKNYQIEINPVPDTDPTWVANAPVVPGGTTNGFASNNYFKVASFVFHNSLILKNNGYNFDIPIYKKVATDAERKPLETAINSGKPNLSCNIYTNLYHTDKTKVDNAIKNKSTAGLIFSSLSYKLTDAQALTYMTPNNIQQVYINTSNITYVLNNKKQKAYTRLLAHELGHLYYTLKFMVSWYKWAEILSKAEINYPFNYIDFTAPNGTKYIYCSKGAGHEYWNPSGQTACNKENMYPAP
jgi:hypothetical protein